MILLFLSGKAFFKFFRHTEHKYHFLRCSFWNSSDSNQVDITESFISTSTAALQLHSCNSWKFSLCLRVPINIPQSTSNKAREFICLHHRKQKFIWNSPVDSGFASVIFKSGRCGRYLFYADINLLDGEDEYFLWLKTHTLVTNTVALLLNIKWCASWCY